TKGTRMAAPALLTFCFAVMPFGTWCRGRAVRPIPQSTDGLDGVSWVHGMHAHGRYVQSTRCTNFWCHFFHVAVDCDCRTGLHQRALVYANAITSGHSRWHPLGDTLAGGLLGSVANQTAAASSSRLGQLLGNGDDAYCLDSHGNRRAILPCVARIGIR